MQEKIEKQRKLLNHVVIFKDDILNDKVLEHSKKLDKLMNILADGDSDLSDISKFTLVDGSIDTEQMSNALINKMIWELEPYGIHCPMVAKRSMEKVAKQLLDQVVKWDNNKTNKTLE